MASIQPRLAHNLPERQCAIYPNDSTGYQSIPLSKHECSGAGVHRVQSAQELGQRKRVLLGQDANRLFLA